MDNTLRYLRKTLEVSQKDMVSEVKKIYPKYDKTIHSKCEHGDKYGIELRADAKNALLKKFDPDGKCSEKPLKRDNRRLQYRISCRLGKADYELLQQKIEADKYATMQDCLSTLVKNYIKT